MGPTLERRGRCAAGDPTNQVGWKFTDPTVAGLTELADDRWRRVDRKNPGGRLGTSSCSGSPGFKSRAIRADERVASGGGRGPDGDLWGNSFMRIRRKDHGNSSGSNGDVLVIDANETPGDVADGVVEDGVQPAVGLVETATQRKKGLLGEVLVARGVVTEEQVATALNKQGSSGKRLGEVLVEMGALDERNLVTALADYFGIPVTDLRRDTPDPAALALVPEGLARENLAIPVFVDDEGFPVAGAKQSGELLL